MKNRRKKQLLYQEKKCRRTSGEEKIQRKKKKKRKEKKSYDLFFFSFFSPSRFRRVFQSYTCPYAHVQPEMLVRKEKWQKDGSNLARSCRLPDWQKKTNVSENESPLSQASRTFCIHQYMENFMTRSRCGSPKAQLNGSSYRLNETKQ